MQIRLASLTRTCGDRMHDSPGSRTCCFSLVQCVRRLSTIPAGSQIQCVGLGRADSIHDSDSVASGSGGRVVAEQRLDLVSPSVFLEGAPLQRARVNMVTAKCRAENPLGVEENIRNLTNLALVSSQIPWILCPTAVSRLKIQQVQSLHVVASQTVGNRRSGTEPARGAWSCRPAGHNPRGFCPRRDGHVLFAGTHCTSVSTRTRKRDLESAPSLQTSDSL